jgi:hypothetical protein
MNGRDDPLVNKRSGMEWNGTTTTKKKSRIEKMKRGADLESNAKSI